MLVTLEGRPKSKVAEASNADEMLMIGFGKVSEKSGNACYWSVVFIPIEKIRCSRVMLLAYKERVTSHPLIVKEGENVYVYFQLVFVEMDIMRRDGVGYVGEAVAFKHIIVFGWAI